jgi:hypothetical protein
MRRTRLCDPGVHMAPRGLWSCLVAVGVLTLSGQTPASTFEVASVKRLDRPVPPSRPVTPPRGATFYRASTTVASLIQFAYDLGDFELVRREQRDMRFAALVLAGGDGRLGPRLTRCDHDAPPTEQLGLEFEAGSRICRRSGDRLGGSTRPELKAAPFRCVAGGFS